MQNSTPMITFKNVIFLSLLIQKVVHLGTATSILPVIEVVIEQKLTKNTISLSANTVMINCTMKNIINL